MNSPQEVLFIYGQNVGWLGRTNGRRANLFLEQRHFTKKLVRPHRAQPELPAIGHGQCFDLALLNDVHAVAGVSLLKNHLTCFVFFAETCHLLNVYDVRIDT